MNDKENNTRISTKEFEATLKTITGAKNALRDLSRTLDDIKKYSTDIADVPKKLAVSFKDAHIRSKKYFEELNKLTKEQLATVSNSYTSSGRRVGNDILEAVNPYSVKKLTGTRNALQQQILASQPTYDTLNIQDAAKMSENQDIGNKQLFLQSRLEMAQLGAQVAEYLNQGVTQAMAAAEAKFRTLASDSFSQGDWLKTKEYFEEAKSSNMTGNLTEAGITTVSNGLAAGVAAGAVFGPVGMAVTGTVAALVTLASQLWKTTEEIDAINVEMNRAKQQMINAAIVIPSQYNDLYEQRNHERILNDPIYYKDYIADNAVNYKNKADEVFDRAGAQAQIISDLKTKVDAYEEHKKLYGVKDENSFELNNPSFSTMESYLSEEEKARLKKQSEDDINALFERRAASGSQMISPHIPDEYKYEYKVQRHYEENFKPKYLNDEETQRLGDAQSSYTNLITEYEKFDKLSKTYAQVTEATAKAIEAKEAEKKRLEEEKKREEERKQLEQQATEQAKQSLYNTRDQRTFDTQRQNYVETANKLIQELGLSEALKELQKTHVFGKDVVDSNLAKQERQLLEINKKVQAENEKLERGELDARGIANLAQLEAEQHRRAQQLDADRKLYSNEDLKKQEEEEKKKAEQRKKYEEKRDELTTLKDQYTSAQSSQYLAQNLGSFSRYFGQTDPSLALIKETNTTLKSILMRIENLDINNPASYQ